MKHESEQQWDKKQTHSHRGPHLGRHGDTALLGHKVIAGPVRQQTGSDERVLFSANYIIRM